MARRKRTTTTRKTSAARRRKPRKTKSKNRLANVIVPLFFILCIVCGIAFISVMGYRTATASSFFEVKEIEIAGTARSSKDDIEDIVRRHSAKDGVWYADIDLMKKEIEEQKYVKRASVSRVLPDRFRVIVGERQPKAVVRLEGKDYWVCADGVVLARVKADEKRPSFTMFGWDQRKTELTLKRNQERVALYATLRDEWKEYGLADRVKAVDLSDMKDPRAIVTDSGRTVTIYLGSEDFRNGLKRGIENIAGRGQEVESIIVSGARPVIEYRDS